ncbi:MAG TPA: hypothetical protein VGB52_08165 [Actinomycetota bacterium]|jgi:hypothetical protein
MIAVLLCLSMSSMVPAVGDEHGSLDPPYEKTGEQLGCGTPTFATCVAEGEFDPSDGTVEFDLSVEAGPPVGAGSGIAFGGVAFSVDDELTVPVESLAYEVDVHVASASASVTGVYANSIGLLGSGYALAQMSAGAANDSCACGGSPGNATIVTAFSDSVPDSLTDATFRLRVEMLPEEGEEMIPAGRVRVTVALFGNVGLGFGIDFGLGVPDTGEAAVLLDAQVTGIRRAA